MDNFYRSLIFKKLKPSILMIPFLAVAVYMFSGRDASLNCIIGFILGCLNFAMLCLNMTFVVDARFQRIRLIQPLLILGRYIIVFLLFISIIKLDKTSVISAFLGMMLVNMAAVFFSGKGFSLKRKEG